VWWSLTNPHSMANLKEPTWRTAWNRGGQHHRLASRRNVTSKGAGRNPAHSHWSYSAKRDATRSGNIVDGKHNCFDMRLYESDISFRNWPRHARCGRLKVTFMDNLISASNH